MSYRVPVLALLVGALASTSALARQTVLENIPLKWSPTSTMAEMGPVDLSAADLAVKIQVEPLVDSRQNPTLIGQNTEKPDKPLTVTTSSDVPEFATGHLKDTLKAAGLSVVDGGGDLILMGEIRQYFVAETNTYHGELSLVLHLKNRAGKEALGVATITGDAEARFGRSYRADNYMEVLADTLLKAAHNLLTNPGFHDASGKALIRARRAELVAACRELNLRGLTYGTSGNISIRCDTRVFFISPSGADYETLKS